MRRSFFGCAVLVALCACGVEEQRFVVENEAVALTASTPPAFVDDDDNPVWVIERRFGFPIKAPKSQTLDALTRRATQFMPRLPFPRLPWVEEGDIDYQVDFVLANLDNQRVVALVSLDGINEFDAYTPSPTDLHQWQRGFALEPKQRVTYTITELEMSEVAIDLATVVNGAPNSNLVVDFQSQSGRDPRVKRYIPKVIPGLVAVRMGITTSQAANVVLEISVRAQDHGDRLANRGTHAWQLPMPMDFAPIVPEEVM